VLNVECFHSTKKAQVAINIWLRQYDQIRPHHALSMRPPAPENLLEKLKISGAEQGGSTVSGLVDVNVKKLLYP